MTKKAIEMWDDTPAEISADTWSTCRLICRPIVSTDTRSRGSYNRHDPNFFPIPDSKCNHDAPQTHSNTMQCVPTIIAISQVRVESSETSAIHFDLEKTLHVHDSV